MVKNREVKFNGIKWIKKKGIYVDGIITTINTWKRKIECNFKNNIVLDAGCGAGNKTYYFSQFGKEIHGIDISQKDIEEAKDRFNAKNLFFKVASVEQIPFRDNTFDVVCSCWVIEHLENPKKFIDEAFRVLKPGGIFILWAPNVKSIIGFLTKIIPLAFKVEILRILSKKPKEKVSHHKCYYRANSIRKIDKLTKSKFKRLYLERFDSFPEPYRNNRILTYLWYLIWYMRKKILKNKLINWMQPSFYVEYKKCT